MKARRDFFLPQVVLLLSVVIPLAMAEQVWWYLAATLAAIGLGWWSRRRGRRPMLGPVTSRLFVLLAFCWLLVEHLWLLEIPVIALSHFMTLVCVSKFLQARTLRDDAQLIVLSLLLLVVAAIVSGNVIFLGVLIVSMTASLGMLIRFNLAVEQAHVVRTNAIFPPAAGDPPGVLRAERAPRGIPLVIGVFSVAAGLVVFTLFPRVGAGMFGRVDSHSGGMAATGVSTAINFYTAGPINESDRQVMRVVFEATHGRTPPDGEPVYLRGRVYEYYLARGPRGWEWRRSRWPRVLSFELEGSVGRDEPVHLLGGLESIDDRPMLIARYQLEPGVVDDAILFSQYPPVLLQGLNVDDLELVTKSVHDQILRLDRSPRKALRYTLHSPLERDAAVVEALEEERGQSANASGDARRLEPSVREPMPPLPQDARIRALIAPVREAAGPLDVPENRVKFARLLVQYLRSPPFAYTLSPPPLRQDVEPIGHFLIESRKGHCQHFASAMTIMCQMAGIPARLVSGFCCDDYNVMGQFYSVRGKHAHAWVEVYIPGQDWVIFDPTPASAARGQSGLAWLEALRGYNDYIQFQWANLVLSYDAESRRRVLQSFKEWLQRPAHNEATPVGKVLAFARELFTWRVQMSLQDRLLYWVFAILVVAMVVLIGYVVAVLSWRLANRTLQLLAVRRSGIHRAGDAGLYHRFCRRLAGIGLRRRADQTPAEFAEELAARFPPLAWAPDLVQAHYGIVYGRHSLTPERRRAFENLLSQIGDARTLA